MMCSAFAHRRKAVILYQIPPKGSVVTDIIELIFKAAEIAGTVAFAVSGAMVAIDRGLDLFGVLFLGIVTALGGGTVRDVILGEIPPRMFYNYRFLAVALSSALLVFLIAYIFRETYFDKREKIDAVCNIFDGIGLAAFSVTGVSYAIGAGFMDNPFLCIFLGMTTGIGGGVLRDMMTKSIPLVLQKRIYAVAALTGSAIYWCMVNFGASLPFAMVLSMSAVMVIRIFATRFKWNLPRIVQ